MAFTSPSERSWNAGTALRWFLLSWDWGPCCRCTSHASTPGSEPEGKLSSDRRRWVPVPVPPSWFRTTSTVCSAYELRVCCTPQPVKGSPRFMRAGRGSPEGGSVPGSVPAVQFAPSEEFPSSAAGNASLRPLPSCRYRPARHRAPAEAGVRCRPRSPLVRGAYDRRASLGRGDRAPKGEAPIPADGAVWLRRAGWAGSGDRWAGLRRAPSPGPARWVRGSEEPRACLGGVGGSCRAGRGRIGSEEPGVRTRGNGGGRRSEEHRRRVPGASRGGSEEPLRPSVARAPKSLCGRCPDGVGPQVRRPASPPRWRGSAPSGRGVPAEPGRVVEAPKSHGGEPGITGVRARRLGTGCEEEVPMR